MTDVRMHHECDYCAVGNRKPVEYLRWNRGRVESAACANHLDAIFADLARAGGEITTTSGAPARLTLPSRVAA
jgi:hypothetical protein